MRQKRNTALQDLKYFLPAVIWSSFILLLSWNVAGLNLPPVLTDLAGIDKLGHLVVYSVLAVSFLYGFYRICPGWTYRLYFVFIWCSLYGFMMEILQFFCFPGRYFEIYDILANIAGVTIGIFFFKFALDRYVGNS